ncbi:glutamyl-tRNA(Gln) amidotransferase A subunit [Tieghemostelium lacteum]|uniref:Glutamyl-tRNA(Gln) amidotransferase subunit A, mitochondrial n=1 Tax=Tieghemostelium lacteum TaxID=361077 RepID=A0A151ZIH5_TIELA|nr:glutamyl-tRNA(Gln) amidotransferase A subunit [Tieghemostelium lacteum]|eukprot:KYQ93715.1 glutamyl-tRNA(Gln) amidotransferase A subunit [Tieghemostelium lacteum]
MFLQNIKQIQKSLKGGNLKVRDLVDQCLRAIDSTKHGKQNYLNTFVTLENRDNLDRLVSESQKRLDSGNGRKLEGIPIAIKDNFSSNSLKTTCASKILCNYIPTFDSTVVRLLKSEGAIILGKTNMDEFSMGSSSSSGCWGSVVNPWSEDIEDALSAGGSSGGSAAAVSSRQCIAAIGSDTGGSIRQPASYCGVVGFKPSYGLISRYGLVSYASSLDTPGILANSVDDVVQLFDVLMHRDEHKDSTSISFGTNTDTETTSFIDRYRLLSGMEIKDLKFGVPMDYLVKEMDKDIIDLWKEVVEEIENAGGKVVPVSLPHTKHALSSYYILATSEASSNLSRYDGIRYGDRLSNEDSQAKNLKELYTETRTRGFGEEVKKRILLGTMALSKGSFDNFYTKAQKIRRLVSEDFVKAFESVDVLVTPTAPSTAFSLSQKTDPIHMYINDIMTIPSNLAGVPSISLPLKLSKSTQLPISIQLISKRLQDDKLLHASNLLLNLPKYKNYAQEMIPTLIK